MLRGVARRSQEGGLRPTLLRGTAGAIGVPDQGEESSQRRTQMARKRAHVRQSEDSAGPRAARFRGRGSRTPRKSFTFKASIWDRPAAEGEGQVLG